MTPILAKRQHAKLSAPFRSPLINKTQTQNIMETESSKFSGMLRPFPLLSEMKSGPPPSHIVNSAPTTRSTQSIISSEASQLTSSQSSSSRKAILNTSLKATKQFKSPLLSKTVAPSPLGVNTSRTIQALERKLQMIKRAVKITQGDEEERLAELVKKWKKAGREVAWDLWHIVREQASDENTGVAYPGTYAKSVSNDGFTGSWGWASSLDNRSSGSFSSNWGFDKRQGTKDEDGGESEDFPSPSKLEAELFRALQQNPNSKVLPVHSSPGYGVYCDDRETNHNSAKGGVDEEGEPDASESKTLGTMLRQFGIAHETLGWNEDEGDFVED